MSTEIFVCLASQVSQTAENLPEDSVLTSEMIAVMVILGGTVVLISFIVTTVVAILYKRKRAFMRGETGERKRRRK